MRRGRQEKARRREAALEMAKNYKPSKNPTGLRERVRRGFISLDEAIELASGYNDDIRGWLSRRKNANVKAPTNKPDSPKKKSRGKQKRKNERNTKKST